MDLERVLVPSVARLRAFAHATVAGDQVFVSGTLGTMKDEGLVPGGTGPETTQALENMRTILSACGCSFADVAKVSVYLTDIDTVHEMNSAYVAAFGTETPARITLGCSGLAFGASVEIDCIAFVPRD